MKTKKYTRVNKCERCENKAGFFIWGTSANVNAGVRAMFKGKICLTCMNELGEVYPNVKAIFKPRTCPACKGNIITGTVGLGSGSFKEAYCEDCGLVVRSKGVE